MRRQSSIQQALTGLAIVLVIAATLLGGVFLAFRDTDRAETLAGELEITAPIRTATSQIDTTTEPSKPTPTPRSFIPTVIVLPTSTVTRATEEAKCPPPDAWLPYLVQEGESLQAIAMRYGLTAEQMVTANCLESEAVAAGDRLAVPPTEPIFSPTPRPTRAVPIPSIISPTHAPATPDATGTQTATDGACTNPDSVIGSPGVGASLQGVVAFRGSARVPNFSFYKLEIRAEGTSTAAGFITFVTSTSQVSNGVLGELNTVAFPNGSYWIRLVVVDTTSNYPERCSILYTIDN